MDRRGATRLLKALAKEMGFLEVGIAKARRLDDEAEKLEAWLNQDRHGRMAYMANHFEKRVDPTRLVPGAKSVVSLLYNYFPSEHQHPDAPKLARYAYGQDYHFILKRKLKTLLQSMQEQIGRIEGRCFVDSAPVLERDWARHSGVGWAGKNTLIINPKAGSYFFLAELIIDLELEYDAPIRDHCGTCTRCIEACPTGAISEQGYLLDARKCISYLTIELRDAIPGEFRDQMEDWVFGCDICQEVCPWNRFSTPHNEPAFVPRDELMEMDRNAWFEITEDVFRDLFKRSAVKRTGYRGLRRNLDFLRKEKTGASGDHDQKHPPQ